MHALSIQPVERDDIRKRDMVTDDGKGKCVGSDRQSDGTEDVRRVSVTMLTIKLYVR